MKRKRSTSCGFTLIEMLVVVAIIGILIGLLLPGLSKIRKRSRRVQCASRLRQLYNATINRVTDHDRGVFPWPCSTEGFHLNRDGDEWGKTATGWVDWYDFQAHDIDTEPNKDDVKTYWWGDKGERCVKRGTLWDYIKDIRVYMCPSMKVFLKRDDDVDPDHREGVRGYVMNGAFSGFGLHEATLFNLSNDKEGMSRRMLFSDAHYQAHAGGVPWGLTYDRDDANDKDEQQWHRRWFRGLDGMLEYDTERLGNWHDDSAMVVFLDGHVERVKTHDSVVVDNTRKVCLGEWGE